MIEITLIYNNQKDIDQLSKNDEITWNLIDELSTAKSNKEAKRIKGYYAARKTPFAVIKIDNEIYKALYSEADDVIKEINNFITLIEQ